MKTTGLIRVPARAPSVNWRAATGIALLALAAIAGYQLRFMFTFADEADNIMAGWLATRGVKLYTDVTTYHFPLEYGLTWIVLSVAGKSIGAVRAAVLACNVATFATTMWVTRKYVGVGLVALAWSLSGPFFFGHMATYHGLTGPLAAGILLISLMALDNDPALHRGAGAVFGVLAGLALIANPLMAVPIATAVGTLILHRAWLRPLSEAAGVSAAIIAATAIILAVYGVLSDFYDLSIRFNMEVYSQYPLGPPLPSDMMLRAAFSGLYVQEVGWMSAWPKTLEWSGIVPNPVDQAVFSGLVLRAAVLTGTAALCVRRQWTAAALAYLFLLATLLRVRDFFQAAPFVVSALMLCVWFMTTGQRARGLSRWLFHAATVMTVAMLGWMIARGGAYTIVERQRTSFDAQWGAYLARTAELRQAACNRTDVSMLYYPLDSILYFLTDMPPASRYQVLYQWTADTQPATIARLSSGKHIVFVNWSQSIWGYKVSNYAKPLRDFLDANYIAKPGNIYLSPELAAVCP